MNVEQREELLAKIAFETWSGFTGCVQEWKDLDLVQQQTWIQTAKVVRENAPAPLILTVALSSSDLSAQPIKKVFYAEETKESLEEMCKELQEWLTDLTFKG